MILQRLTTMAPRRKRTVLTLQQKSEILQKLTKGVSGKVLAELYGVGTSTISDLKKNEKKIMSFIQNTFSGPGKRRTLRKAEYPEMEAELYSWFVKQRGKHVVISSEILAEQAKQLHMKHYDNDKFIASRGWISNFQKRHGIRFLKVSGEKVSSNEQACKSNKKTLSSSQLNNADESALFWKLLSDKTSTYSKKKTTPG